MSEPTKAELQTENERLRGELTRLQGEVERLAREVGSPTQKRPRFYQETAFWTAIVGAIIAICVGLGSWSRAGQSIEVARAEGVKSRAQLFTSSVIELDDKRAQSYRDYQGPDRSRIMDNYGFDPLEPTATRVLFERAKRLEGEVSSETGFAEYLVLANFACAFAGFDEAELYVKKALERLPPEPKEPNNRCIVYATLARMYFRYYPVLPVERGRSYFRQATDALRQIGSGAKNPTIEAEIWADWGMSELRAGFNKEASDCFKQAARIMGSQSLPTAFLMRWKASLRRDADYLLSFGRPMPKVPPFLDWVVDDNFDIVPSKESLPKVNLKEIPEPVTPKTKN